MDNNRLKDLSFTEIMSLRDHYFNRIRRIESPLYTGTGNEKELIDKLTFKIDVLDAAIDSKLESVLVT